MGEKEEILQRVLAAAHDERVRFNAAIAAGAKPMLKTPYGPFRVTHVDEEWWYQGVDAKHEVEGRPEAKRFAGCNDQNWADMLAQIGIERHETFKWNTTSKNQTN